MNNSERNQAEFLVIIVNWNTLELLKGCLEALEAVKKSINFDVLVVDNGSKDGSAEMLKQDYLNCKLILNDKNLGFGKANNLGLKQYPDYPFYLLLNSDTLVNTKTISKMLSVAKSNPRIAAVNPSLILPSGDLQTGGAGFGPGLLSSFNTFTGLSKLSPIFKGLYIEQKHYLKNTKELSVDWVALACTLISRKVLEDIGLLDEIFFVYGEDSEWCWRAKKKGWEFVYLPNLNITHFLGGSTEDKAQLNSKWFEALSLSVKLQGTRKDFYGFIIMGFFGYSFRYLILQIWNVFSADKELRLKKQLCLLSLKVCFNLITGGLKLDTKSSIPNLR